MNAGHRIRIEGSSTGGQGVRFRIAGVPVVSDVELPSIARFRVRNEGVGDAPSPNEPSFIDRSAADESQSSRGPSDLLATRGWIGGRWRDVRCDWTEQGTDLAVEGLPPVHIDPHDHRIRFADSLSFEGMDLAIREELLVGPSLLLALALQGRFALHASAVEIDGSIIAFVGDSGAGKSTIAQPPDEPGRRVADDILIVGRDRDASFKAWLWYPQLKVDDASGRQSPESSKTSQNRLPECRPLGGIVLLSTADASEGGESIAPNFVHLAPIDAALASTRHTVASKLFSPALLRDHLDFMTELVCQVPVVRLCFRHDISQLPSLRRTVERYARQHLLARRGSGERSSGRAD